MTIANKVKTKQPLKKKPVNTTSKQISQSDETKKSPETITTKVKSCTLSKASRAMIIMEDQWDNLQSGKIKRKDIIQRFISEVGLTPKGASTYFGNCKKKLTPKQLKN
ncbi:MAG: hypothetical protein QNL62_20410 [Gammaproteobacteria bacterium]|nr:hypothetical protein [Gammaproteobacteria bacterium]